MLNKAHPVTHSQPIRMLDFNHPYYNTVYSSTEQDSEPQVAPDGQAGTLQCECEYEWVNEKQNVKRFECRPGRKRAV